MIEEIETAVDPKKSFGAEKLLFKFTLNDFGRDRMRQSGLLEVTTWKDFFAYGFGPYLAVILLVVLPALALYQARTFVKKL